MNSVSALVSSMVGRVSKALARARRTTTAGLTVIRTGRPFRRPPGRSPDSAG
jgi:hypothetical protein